MRKKAQEVALTTTSPVTWDVLHRSVAYGRYPLVDFPDPNCWIICLLHMHLRIVGGLFTATMVDKIDAFPSTGGEKSQTDRLYHILTKEGRIHIKRTKLQKKSNSLDKPD